MQRYIYLMSESNYNWVCFECRFVTRQAKTFEKISKCHFCNQDCVCLGYKIKIPQKRDIKGWNKLQLSYRQMKLYNLEIQKTSIRYRICRLEDEIQRLISKENNKDRNRLIHSKKKELVGLQKLKI